MSRPDSKEAVEGINRPLPLTLVLSDNPPSLVRIISGRAADGKKTSVQYPSDNREFYTSLALLECLPNR